MVQCLISSNLFYRFLQPPYFCFGFLHVRRIPGIAGFLAMNIRYRLSISAQIPLLISIVSLLHNWTISPVAPIFGQVIVDEDT